MFSKTVKIKILKVTNTLQHFTLPIASKQYRHFEMRRTIAVPSQL